MSCCEDDGIFIWRIKEASTFALDIELNSLQQQGYKIFDIYKDKNSNFVRILYLEKAKDEE